MRFLKFDDTELAGRTSDKSKKTINKEHYALSIAGYSFTITVTQGQTP